MSMNSSGACAITCRNTSLDQAPSRMATAPPCGFFTPLPSHFYRSLRGPPAASGQFLLRDQHAVGVGIHPIAGIDRHAGDVHAHIALAHAFFAALLRMRGQRAHADVTGIDFVGVADAAIDNDAGPAVVLRQQPQLTTDQRAAQAAAAIDHQHIAVARRFQRRAHQRVILVHLQRHHATGEAQPLAVMPEDRRQHGQAAIVQQSGVVIAQIGGGETHGDPLHR
ncbi:conserved hypothetical protein [Ricinus communis]|uniref:Uncharacterized protein n=1 Tax=Ricinus communis TaxID=3988 RepID=B9TLV0_RICCO|nr:conserved hypothetical protein [Ricinus communis]